MNNELEFKLGGTAIAKSDHLLEFPGGVHMQQWEGRLRRPERLDGQVQHH